MALFIADEAGKLKSLTVGTRVTLLALVTDETPQIASVLHWGLAVAHTSDNIGRSTNLAGPSGIRPLCGTGWFRSRTHPFPEGSLSCPPGSTDLI